MVEISGLSFNFEMESTNYVILLRNGQPMLASTISCGQQNVCTVNDECGWFYAQLLCGTCGDSSNNIGRYNTYP